MARIAFILMLAAYLLTTYRAYLAQQELVVLKAHYAKMECVEAFDYSFIKKQSVKK